MSGDWFGSSLNGKSALRSLDFSPRLQRLKCKVARIVTVVRAKCISTWRGKTISVDSLMEEIYIEPVGHYYLWA